MSTLPDINTSNVGYIAYWNALNHGVGSINSSDVLSDSNIQNYTLYDNGFTAQYSSINGRTITVRVKQDGWFVAYIDRTNNFTPTNSSKIRGYWDIINDWSTTGNSNTFPNNTLERSIHSLQSQLSNSGSITYNSSDVGLYNYEYTSATTSTGFSSNSSNGSTETSGLIYTSGTTVDYAVAAGVATRHYYGGSTATAESLFNGVEICNSSQSDPNYGSVNLLSNGLIPNSQTEYDASLVSNHISSGFNGTTNCNVLTIWS